MADVIGKPLDDFVMKDFEGKEMKFSEYRGDQAAFIDFYTSWWGGCNGAAQEVDALNKEYGKQFKICLINIEDKGKDPCVKFIEKNKLSADLAHFIGKAPAQVGLKYIPHKVLVDKDGNIVMNSSVSKAQAKEWFDKNKPAA